MGSSSSRTSVLLVDDDPLILASLRRLLAREFDVTISGTASDALTAIGQRSFHAVVCDVMLPGMSGIDLFETMQRTMPDAAARVIFLTGGAVDARARGFLQSVPNVVLDKGDDLVKVFQAVRSMSL